MLREHKNKIKYANFDEEIIFTVSDDKLNLWRDNGRNMNTVIGTLLMPTENDYLFAEKGKEVKIIEILALDSLINELYENVDIGELSYEERKNFFLD